ncbi:26S protease regulatory subunit [Nocardioides sp. CFH 31398]|uniref:ATP-binding protein n=1 Tax=Nocardioides sp. CFH 31398 TaxID=2919579 RepID=UPI001F05E157|nr:ATP-binding protein [Nocardioides sp. CFH 31398]MCH1866806.1 ATP-binding protein [Nocardioides sp. CFH 31398]
MTDLIASLARAVAAAPDDPTLRLHLARQLVDAGRGAEAVEHAAAVLAADPASAEARAVMAEALAPPAPTAPPANPTTPAAPAGFDWSQAEHDLGSDVEPMFADASAHDSQVPAYDVEGARITLADVGGMNDVKKRLHAAFLAPLRNDRLRQMYRKSLRGGLLMYGPPGVGKTFIARALAGELDAQFLAVGMADIFEMYIGTSERNVQELFATARASAPCVLFLDEVDALGRKRSQSTSDGYRSVVNQLLYELDSVGNENEGVFVLAATNAPWDVDPALRRPGRLDRTLLVLPPDREAREAIWQTHLRERPIAGVDVRRLAKLTDGYTGADIAHLCESAAEIALMDSVESGEPRMIGQADLEAALRELRPSIGPWFESARNVAMFANDDGSYDELLAYLRKHKRL